MFVEDSIKDRLYCGYNPKFARQARARQREQARQTAVAERKREIAEKRQREAKSIVEVARAAQVEADAAYARMFSTSAKAIAIEVALKHGFLWREILAHDRSDRIVAARHAAMAAVYVATWPRMSLPQIGRLFKRDHTSVLHAVKKAGVWRGNDRKAAA